MARSRAKKSTLDKDSTSTKVRPGKRDRRAGPGSVPNDLRALQDAAGNRAVDQLLAGGQPLDPALRAEMESRFGQDFSQVRVHTDGRAAESAQALDAAAYTVGPDVVFAAGRYAPNTSAGQQLLAHELAHVVQQERAAGDAVEPLSQPGDRFEAEADRTAAAAGAGQPARVVASGAPPAVQRQEDPGKRKKKKGAKKSEPSAVKSSSSKSSEARASQAAPPKQPPKRVAEGGGEPGVLDSSRFNLEGTGVPREAPRFDDPKKEKKGQGAKKGKRPDILPEEAAPLAKLLEQAGGLSGEFGGGKSSLDWLLLSIPGKIWRQITKGELKQLLETPPQPGAGDPLVPKPVEPEAPLLEEPGPRKLTPEQKAFQEWFLQKLINIGKDPRDLLDE